MPIKSTIIIPILLIGIFCYSLLHSQEQNVLSFEGSSYKVAFNPDNGSIGHIINKLTGKEIITGEENNTLWEIEYKDKDKLISSEFSSTSQAKNFSSIRTTNGISLIYRMQDFTVTVKFTNNSRTIDGEVTIDNPPKVVLTLNFPHRMIFNPREVKRFYFPHNLGIALKPSFYTLGKGWNNREFGLQQKNILPGRYPDNFSDYSYLDSQDGTLAVYGIQTEREIFVPASYQTGFSDWQEGSGFYDHSFITYVSEKQSWTAPVVRIEVGETLMFSLQNYSKENGFTTLLEDKLSPPLYDKFIKSMLIFYHANSYREMSEGLDLLPSPALLHFTNFLRVGFDRNYPDHLPPNPKYGTPEEFRAFYDRAHEKGMLLMPYTNPTWWCDYPESPAPSVIKYGDAPLARDLNGNLYIEKYWINRGWSLTFAHPIAKEVRRRDVKSLTEDYPSDILLQDQVGARGYQYDTNPACPVPYAYTQGLIDIVKDDSKVVPLSTEDGFDRILNYEVQFCGCTWHIPMWGKKARGWQYPEIFGSDLYEVFPFAHMFAHDKVAFAHHDLAVFVTNRSELRWTLALGYQMSIFLSPDRLKNPEFAQWVQWLDLIQKKIAYYYMGKKMINFEYIAEGVTQTTFHEGATVTANHLDHPYRINESLVIAPRGFFVAAGGNIVGTFIEFDKKKLDKEKWILRDGAGADAKYYYYEPPVDMY